MASLPSDSGPSGPQLTQQPTKPHRDFTPPIVVPRKRVRFAEGTCMVHTAETLVMAAEGGHTWQSSQAACEVTTHPYVDHSTRGNARYLTCDPLIQRLVKIMAANDKQGQVRAATQPPAEDISCTPAGH